MKVLLAGDINGKIDALYKRVNTVNASNGPFAALLCVGSFFNAEGMCICLDNWSLFQKKRSTSNSPLPLTQVFNYLFSLLYIQVLMMLTTLESSYPTSMARKLPQYLHTLLEALD